MHVTASDTKAQDDNEKERFVWTFPAEKEWLKGRVGVGNSTALRSHWIQSIYSKKRDCRSYSWKRRGIADYNPTTCSRDPELLMLVP